MKNFLLVPLLFAGLAAAQSEICVQLCEPCRALPEDDATCASVAGICNCGELLSKAEEPAVQEEAPADAFSESRRALLGDSLFNECEAGKFSFGFWFSNDSVREFRSERQPGVQAVPVPKVKPLGAECVELCQVIAGAEASNPMVPQIEASCGCTKHVEDSLAVIAFKEARIQNAALAADSVVKFCSGAKVCRAQLAVNPETYAVEALDRLPDPKPDSTALARKAIKENRLDSLEDVLYENCFDGNCKIQVKFFEELISLRAATPVHEKISEPAVHDLAGKCAELCAALPDDPENPIAVQMEKTCGCKQHLQDSLALEEFRSVRDSNVSLAADSVVSACFENKNCEVLVALDETSFKLLSLEVLAGVEQVDTAAVQAPKKSVPKTSDSIFHAGASLALSTFTGHYEVDAFDLEWAEAGGFEIAVGLALHWRLAKWLGLQSGLSLAFNTVDLGSETYGSGEIPEGYYGAGESYYLFKYSLKHQGFAAEVPLQARFYYRSAYGTFLLGIRKGLWERVEYDSPEGLAKTGKASSGLGFDNWEFLGSAGLGYEFGRKLLAEVLFGIFDVGTVDEYVRQSFAWRLKLDYIW